MAEMTFSCPGCGQHIECDQLWSGHQISCPTCQAQITVPPVSSSPAKPSPLVPQVPQSKAPRLSAGQTQVARPSTALGAPQRKFQNQIRKEKSPVVKYAIIGAVLVAIAGGVTVGLPYFQRWQESRKEKAAAAEKHAGNPDQAAASGQAGETNPEPAPAPEPPKELPLLPAVWTLDVAEAKVPEGRANGTISGADFVPDAVRIAKVGNAYVLNMRQGQGITPDRGLVLYLHTPTGELSTNNTWSIASEMKGASAGVSQVVKLWKTDPKYAAQQRRYYTGFALKLELGKPSDEGNVSGKIFLALPDQEKSVVAGLFKATTIAVTPGSEMAPAASAAPDPQVDAAARARFQKRYGVPGR